MKLIVRSGHNVKPPIPVEIGHLDILHIRAFADIMPFPKAFPRIALRQRVLEPDVHPVDIVVLPYPSHHVQIPIPVQIGHLHVA